MAALYKALPGRHAVTVCLIAAAGWAAWFCAGLLAEPFIARKLNNVYADLRAVQVEPNTQIDKVLGTLGDLDRSGRECSAEQYSQLADLVKNLRFVDQAAIQLSNGKVCSSYGQELPSILADNTKHKFSVGKRTYWVDSGHAVSADTDFIVVSEQSTYVWANKKLLLDNLKLPEDLQLDLIGPGGAVPIASTGPKALATQKPLHLEELVTSADKVFIAYAGNRNELIAVISLPLSYLTSLKFKLFIGLVCLFAALLLLARCIQRHYTSTAVRLRNAIKANTLSVHYQPIVNLTTGYLVGAESLSRWNVNGNPVPADVFIAVAEKSDLIRQLTRSVIRQVAEDYSTYLWACKDFYITVNLSARDIQDPTFPDFVASLLATYRMPPSAMTFEITERTLLDHKPAAMQLRRLRACGHRIAVDDFGIGYSNLSLLDSVPFDILKIDRSFIADDKIAARDAMWRHIAQLAKSLRLKVVAEGVETQEQLPHLVSEGVVLAQGWLFSKALPIQALARRYFQCPANIPPYDSKISINDFH
ncbi:EAL domain-containing protein [Pseudomonas sp. GM55]|uniref:EAL domain-containing protein n=1 Tax=Pseudomonas sp. GM55 TaxID=1144333 RepID=UPI0002708046|nr:EAL domain-containing protein [Pseudomonas sp. GM55]EJM64970.1 putative signal transduction protein containing sensor and EAL domain-containing protein [Pseudomonas sp. GM55]